MNHCNKYILVSLLCLSIQQISYSQKYIYPVDIPPALSANFGELRGNHFHSGIDFKTQQVQNKPIIAIEDG
ncbi:MAG TPA: M23 family peptidase, partial [Porphyromonadaceae bacterium]|nr:M23 family peptidase [Porphyromonadaceae bacterium]